MTTVQLAEVNRLIKEFITRTSTFGGVSNGTTLGRLYLERAKMTYDVADYAEAEAVLAVTLQAAPESTDTMMFLGYATNAMHRFSDAIALARDVLAREPDRLDAVALLGDTALSLGDFATARQSYDRLAETLSNRPEVLIRQAQIARLDGDPGRALALATAAVDSSATDERGFYLAAHGALAFGLGQASIAIVSFDAALLLDPTYPPAVEGRGVARAVLGDFDGAIADLTVMTTKSPDLHAHLIFGDIYTLSGDEERAEEQYEIALSIDDPYGLFVRQIAMYRLDHNGDVAAARQAAADELDSRSDPGAFDLAAWAAYRDGDLREARRLADAGLSLAEPTGLALYHAAAISDALGETDRAIEELERALANPYFDLLGVGKAQAMLDGLRGGGS